MNLTTDNEILTVCIATACSNQEATLLSHGSKFFDRQILCSSSSAVERALELYDTDLLVISEDLSDRDRQSLLQRERLGSPFTPTTILIARDAKNFRWDQNSDCSLFDVLSDDLSSAERVSSAFRAVSQYIRLQRQFSRLTIRDAETGLYNRNFIEFHLDSALEKFKQTSQPLTVTLLSFSSPEDQIELAADSMETIINQVAHHFTRNMRTTDIICRVDKQKFMIVMPDTDEDSAFAAMGRVFFRGKYRNWGDRSFTTRLPFTGTISFASSRTIPVTTLIEMATDNLCHSPSKLSWTPGED
ncbi:GGDEF domain-containing protein [Pseudobacteriovorax antillogorgiicola]|uniref:Diguanylate cyclase (GGDEF) domain-containing protein n=1 Tax=Pseudobacteriovorax antillogorgiicola TaxID=1513793 RepID=A0A1Y6BB85_9BACT|nr:GGDEF domain-containing protein [Pseudobacteriovorax antillogorgiicola]TCS57428.1 diguanylate cyclase (GGDEF)-like protein [Pseudobacteriovorax antillogorgiicola]SMF01219.1 diguanylate cyclase (GGDEF) domain-containing protein [Pseudobacteriovorax antillogorgiicola]